jgi:hypothetical protein
LLFSKTDATLDALTTSLKQDFIMTVEGDVGAYLGIDIRGHSDGRLEMVQPGLIRKIIADCGLQDSSHTHNTPSETKILQRDPHGAPREHTWNYRSIIGMLTYLSVTTRPDIAYSVHQCARFSTCPKRSHELAARRIVCYLKGTADKGYFLQPSSNKTLDCYVDADFAGNWTPITSADPSSAKSRTGYVIMFANCPLLWASKLQTEVALSTTEAEYIALSQAMHDLIPLRALLQDITSVTKIPIGNSTTYSTVFEDNKSCVELIKAPKMNPRMRHIAIKYHHFRDHVHRGFIQFQWIDTARQIADIITKPLAESKFTFLRERFLGW